MPDLVNPNITAYDTQVIDRAAAEAIREGNLEAAEEQKKEEEAAEAKKFSWSKFWLIVIITFSVILGICALVSIIAVVVLCCMGTPGPPPGKDVEGDDETEGLADAAEPAENAPADANVEES